ncbi:hypothetical protein C2E21_4443 [Chlorella sorokiniana]|uniref:Uncharacterized protein n=1 Tax=Chlorella sorokiniana TaxID=3076 RepID=A0A2P6TQQ7_CHLSO|nr:hypothetical protein C2E21_4443 [Chlorella sorokiniana]|eukprot:PRW56394.1 hypothetical protein C2E21_4443 [Chlorella sorokiniana]
MADSAASAPAAGGAPPSAAVAAVAADVPPAESSEAGKQRRNRVKKLKAQYVGILELEQRSAAGQPLDAGQSEKLSRKAAVAAELEAMGVELPEAPPPPPPPLTGTFTHSEVLQSMEKEVSQEEVAGALEKLLISRGGGQRQRPEGPISRALAGQYQLLEANPGFSYFITLPAPLPDIAVHLEDTMGAVFFETMRPRAEAGQPRAVKVMYEQLLPTAQHAGIPAMQLRLQLLTEYGIDPVTEQVVPGSDEERAAWLRSVVPPAEQRAAQRQLQDVQRFRPGRAGRVVCGTREQGRKR